MALVACSSVSTKSDKMSVKIADKVLTAQGYSRIHKLLYLTEKKNQFALEQVATINAYRGLAKRLYKERLTKGLSVADQVIKAEAFRIYLDLYMRQAKVIESKMIRDQKNVKLALVLTPRFYSCLSTTVEKVSTCLREDGKIQYTRIAYQQASVSTVNISCSDCASQLSVSGFSKEANVIDNALLNMGFYDLNWVSNSAASAFARYWFFTNMVFN